MKTTPPRKQRGRPPTLSKDKIIDVALSIPFEQLSMVLVAKKLRVSDAALYYYFPTSDSLRRAAIHHLSANFKLPQRSKHWKNWMRSLALSLFDFFGERPGSAAYMMSTGPTGFAQYTIIEKALGVLTTAGFTLEHAWLVYSNVISLTIEYAHKRDELEKIEKKSSGESRSHFPADLGKFSTDDFPLTRQAAAIQARLHSDAHFLFGLEAMLNAPEKRECNTFVSTK